MATLPVAIDARRAQSGARQAKQAIDSVTRASSRWEQQSARTERQVDRLGTTGRRTGGLLRNAFTGLAALGAITSAVRTIGSFAEGMARIRGIVRQTTPDLVAQQIAMAKLTDVARKLGATTSFTSTQAAEGLLYFARAGFTVQEMVNSLPPTLDLAKVAQIDLAQAADITANTLRQFGIEAERSEHVIDVLALTSARTNTNLTDLAEGLKLAGPIAHAAGISYEETAASLGILANAGLKATIGGTNLRGVLVGLLDPNKDARAIIRDLTDAEGDQADILTGSLVPALELFRSGQIGITEAVQLFTRRAAGGATVLIDQAELVRELTKANVEATGVAHDMSEEIGKELPSKFKALQSAIEAVILESGDQGLRGVLEDVVDWLTNGVRALDKSVDQMNDAEGAARALVIGLGSAGLLGVVRALVVLLGPVGLVGGLIAGAVALAQFLARTDATSRAIHNLRTEFDGLNKSLELAQANFEIALRRSDLQRQATAAREMAQAFREQASVLERQKALRQGQTVPLSALRTPSGGFLPGAFEAGLQQRRAAIQTEIQGTNIGNFPVAAQARLNALNAQLKQVETFIKSGREPTELVEKLFVPLEKAIDLKIARAESLEREADQLEKEATQAREKAKQDQINAGRPAAIGGAVGRLNLGRFADSEETLGRSVRRTFIEQMRERANAIRDAQKEVQRFIDDLQTEVDLLGMSRDKREQELAIIDAENIAREAGIDITSKEANQIRDLVARRQDLERKQRGPESVLQDPEALASGIAQKARQIGDSIATAFLSPIRDAILNGGTPEEIGRALVQNIEAAVLDALVFQPLENLLAGLIGQFAINTGTAGSLFVSEVTTAGNIFTTAVTAASLKLAANSGVITVGNGGAFSMGEMLPFAFGGTVGGVVTSPTAFALSGGRLGVAGERGPEAILPLKRGPGGKLGVRAESGSRGSTIINNRYVITVRDESHLRRTQRMIEQDQRRQLQRSREG